jgi:UDP-N-acetylmuramate--alanine ligase
MGIYHFIGIGGIGMSGLARILLKRGSVVQGSDAKESCVTEALKEAGAAIFYGESTEKIAPPMIVVYGSAIGQHHPERAAAVENGLRLIHRSHLLGELMQGSRPLLVTGTHGKTTTSSLLAHLLLSADLAPSFAVGGMMVGYESNADHGRGEYFVAEADESDGSFLNYPAFGAIITNIERDHLDHWKSEEALVDGFRTFAARVESPEHLFWCADDARVHALALPGTGYGFSKGADLRITRWEQRGWTVHFDCAWRGETYREIVLPLTGVHNVLNGAAVFGLGLSLGIPEADVRQALATFPGVKRRLEKRGEKRGVVVFDDYGHHPTEIEATLKAVRAATAPRRLVAIFQPHRYTRTRDLARDFIPVFKEADLLILTDIYGAGEAPIPGVSAETLFPTLDTAEAYLFSRDGLAAKVAPLLRPHDVVVTMGAGDITALADELLDQEIRPLRLALITGGKSAEHEVAQSSCKVLRMGIRSDLYEILDITIAKNGQWEIGGKARPWAEIVTALSLCDVAFPVLHGAFSEDGMVQGFLETLGIPYTGCDYRTGPVVMDKAWTKRLATTHGLDVAPFLEFTLADWRQDRSGCLAEVLLRLPFPLFVKPVHLGSTIGVCRVTNSSELEAAIETVLTLDLKFIVEVEIMGREMEIGILGSDVPFVSDPAEVVCGEGIYTYEGKYGPNPTPTRLKVALPDAVREAGKAAALAIYRACNCTGLSRIDFFLTPTGRWILNEVNPMPGCTPTSAYPKMMAAEGIALPDLVDRLVIEALSRRRIQDRHLRPPS